MSLFIVVVLEDSEERKKRSRERRAESGELELSFREHTKNCIITTAKIYTTLYNFCNRRCYDIQTNSVSVRALASVNVD